ncbi:hypothetical protein BKA57DRAFT_501845 [Linnemannia elongata]|nr:hypothetical protein BKA57DRAFT_501845 [Linnemannia elongata]
MYIHLIGNQQSFDITAFSPSLTHDTGLGCHRTGDEELGIDDRFHQVLLDERNRTLFMADHFTSSTSYRDHVKTLPDSIETFRNNNLGILLNNIHHHHYTTTRLGGPFARTSKSSSQPIWSSWRCGFVIPIWDGAIPLIESDCRRKATVSNKELPPTTAAVSMLLHFPMEWCAYILDDKHLHISNQRSISFLQASFNDNLVKNTKKLW